MPNTVRIHRTITRVVGLTSTQLTIAQGNIAAQTRSDMRRIERPESIAHLMKPVHAERRERSRRSAACAPILLRDRCSGPAPSVESRNVSRRFLRPSPSTGCLSKLTFRARIPEL